jgi:integrase
MGKTKNRANGDGDVFTRKNKEGKITSYRGAYFGPDGKRRYVSGETKEEAHRALRKARSCADQGFVFDAGRLTVAEYLDRWLEDSVQGSVRRSTYESYRRQARRYITPAVGSVRLKALTPAHVQRLYREMRAAGSRRGPSSTRTLSCTGRSSWPCGGTWSRATSATPWTSRR